MSTRNLNLWGACSIFFNAGVPTYVWQSGEFTGVLTDTGVGDVGVLLAGGGIDSDECVVMASIRGTLAASQLTTVAVEHTSDTTKDVTILREGAMGAASAAADVSFDLLFIKTRLI